jgi:hypothetical protein
MGSLLKKLVGTPAGHEEEKAKSEVVKTPEFDITQYAKKLALGIPVFVGGTAAALEVFTDLGQSEGIAIAAIGLAAVALFAVSLVMAVDVAARAYLAGSGSASKAGGTDGSTDPPARSQIVPAPPGTKVWLEGSEQPNPVLAIATDDEQAVSYLVAVGPTVERPGGKRAIDGAPKWYPAEKVRAVKPAKWP